MSLRRVASAAHMSSPPTSTVPLVGGNNPIMARSTVLLPLPLPPMTAKIDPRRTEKLRSLCTTFGPNAKVSFSQRSNSLPDVAAATASDTEDICAHRKDCIQGNDPDDADDDSPCCGTSHLG